MLKIGQLYLDEGRWQGRRIVSSHWVKTSTTNQLTQEQTTSEGSYGYLWWIGDIESHPYFAAIGSGARPLPRLPGVVQEGTIDRVPQDRAPSDGGS